MYSSITISCLETLDSCQAVKGQDAAVNVYVTNNLSYQKDWLIEITVAEVEAVKKQVTLLGGQTVKYPISWTMPNYDVEVLVEVYYWAEPEPSPRPPPEPFPPAPPEPEPLPPVPPPEPEPSPFFPEPYKSMPRGSLKAISGWVFDNSHGITVVLVPEPIEPEPIGWLNTTTKHLSVKAAAEVLVGWLNTTTKHLSVKATEEVLRGWLNTTTKHLNVLIPPPPDREKKFPVGAALLIGGGAVALALAAGKPKKK